MVPRMVGHSKSETCNYEFSDKSRCREPVFFENKCILHVEFPHNRNGSEFQRISDLKERRLREKTVQGDYSFEGARLPAVDFSRQTIKADLDFRNSVIYGAEFVERFGTEEWTKLKSVTVERATIKGGVNFEAAKTEGDVCFNKTKIRGSVRFS